MADPRFIRKREVIDLLMSATALKRADIVTMLSSLTNICCNEVSRGNIVALAGLGRLGTKRVEYKRPLADLNGRAVTINGRDMFIFRASIRLRRGVRAKSRKVIR